MCFMLTFLVVILMCSLFGSYVLFVALLTRAIGEETTLKEIFEEYVARLQEKAKEKERRREEEKVILHVDTYQVLE